MKAIHNVLKLYLSLILLYLITQRYKMKAIHNELKLWQHHSPTVFNHPKIQNESNSQHVSDNNLSFKTVFNHPKIQNESNSQRSETIFVINSTVFNHPKIQNESNSQLTLSYSLHNLGCI